MNLVGYIDYADPTRVTGWAALVSGPLPCANPIRPELLITIDDKCVAKIAPNIPRNDLRSLFGERVDFGFDFSFAVAGMRVSWGVLIAVTDRCNRHLQHSPIRLEVPSTTWLGYSRRVGLACHYLAGNGIEVGALHSPMPVGPRARVKYVDRMSLKDLRRHYPEMGSVDLLDPDIISDGERLSGIDDASQDFVIANHVIEHLEDPIGSIKNLLRVLRVMGLVFITIPDKRHTVDKDRSLTSIDHLIIDHERGVQVSRSTHYFEWATTVNNLSYGDAIKRADNLQNIGYAIHFHVWQPETFLAMLLHIRDRYSMPFEIELFCYNVAELLVLLRKI